MSGFICPQPRAWDEVHKKLQRTCAQRGLDAGGIPVPLILDGWWHSSDEEKRARWEATVAWAQRNGLGEVIPALSEATGYAGVPA